MKRYIWLGVVVVAIIVAAIGLGYRWNRTLTVDTAGTQPSTATPTASGTAATETPVPGAASTAPAATTTATQSTAASTQSTAASPTAAASAPSASTATATPGAPAAAPAATAASSATATAPTAASTTASSTAAGAAAPTQQAALPSVTVSPPLAGSAAGASTGTPSFDVVRVDPSGSLVIAGRAAPGSAVTVTSDGAAIGNAIADANGEWVILPPDRVSAGNHQLALSATTPGGATVPADRLVMLAVPAAGRDATGKPAAAPGSSLALLVPKGDTGGTVVLQQPAAPDAAPAEAAATAAPAGSGSSPAATASGAPAAATATSMTVGAKAAAQSGGISDGALALDAVDYDDRGDVTIGGRGSIGATVQVYLDNQLIGAAMVDAAGRWQVAPTGDVAPRLHTLRVDQIARDGKVVARVESPFLRAGSVTLPADQAFVVQPGNSLWRIARRTYGNGLRYSVIYAANKTQIRNPDLIYPGQVFAIPPTQTN